MTRLSLHLVIKNKRNKMKNLKKYIISAATLFFASLMYSQHGNLGTPVQIQCSSYTPKPELDKFTGHWKWTSGNNSFEMVLKKEKIFNITGDTQACKDVIIGFHEYIKNGVLIESSLQNQNTNFNQDFESIYFPGGYIANNTVIAGGIDILSNGNHARMELEYIDSTHLKIKSLMNYEGAKVYPEGQPIPSSEINLIIEGITLTKQ